MIIKILINPDGIGYCAYCPSLGREYYVWGVDYQDALKNICEMILDYLKSMKEHGDNWLNEMGIKIEMDKIEIENNK